MLEKNVMVSFLKKFDQYPFCVKMDDDKYTIGEWMPQFTVGIKEKIPMDSLITSTSNWMERMIHEADGCGSHSCH